MFDASECLEDSQFPEEIEAGVQRNFSVIWQLDEVLQECGTPVVVRGVTFLAQVLFIELLVVFHFELTSQRLYFQPQHYKKFYLNLNSLRQDYSVYTKLLQSMKNTFKLTQSLPLTHSFTSKLSKAPIPCKLITRNLGNNFYPRLASIYRNLLESLLVNNTHFFTTSAIPQLSAQLTRRKQQLGLQGVKLKSNEPIKKLIPLKNYLLPETVYRDDNFYISVACKVYFGGQFGMKRSFSWLSNQKVFRLGKHRSLIWDSQKSLSENISRLGSQQIFEFVVRVESNLYINLYDLQSSSIYQPEKIDVKYDEDSFQDIRATELVLRSSSHQFDWVLHDINGILRTKNK